MRLSKKLTLGWLLVSFAFLIGGCESISNPFSQDSSGEAAKNNKTDLEKQKQEKQSQITNLKTNLKNQQDAQKTETDKCNEMEKSTVKAGKNPKDPKDSPQTFAQCQKRDSITGQIATIKNTLSQAEGELEDIESKIIQASKNGTNEKNDNFNWITFLLFGFAGIVGLGLLGGLYFLLNRKIEREREAATSGFNAVRAEQRELSRQIKQLGEAAKLQNDRIERQQNTILALQKQSSEAGKIGYAAQPQQIYEQPQVYKPEPQFPVSAEDYLNKVRANGQKASADLIGGLLVQDPNKNEEFLIVKDNALADGLFYAVPSFNRFSTRSDYLTYYQNYYACENPSGGAVWILVPTTVRRVEGGWKLEDMGELEIR